MNTPTFPTITTRAEDKRYGFKRFVQAGDRERIAEMYDQKGYKISAQSVRTSPRIEEVTPRRWAELQLLVLAGHAVLGAYPAGDLIP